MKRNLTKKEEQVLRLHHHDFGGLSIDDTATEMGVGRDTVVEHLRCIKKKTPQLFPILAPIHRAILEAYDQGAFELRNHPQKDEPMYEWQRPSRKAVAEGLGISGSLLDEAIRFLHKHGFLWNRRMAQFDPSMDSQVKERF
ncbi:MAG: hypothetical protein GY938_30725 [Ketobacter sp.]|nr:hypothetical protein [Ketobacter sp.]